MKTTRTSVTHPTARMGVVYMFLSFISGVSLLPSLYGHVPEAEVGGVGSSVIMRCKGSNLTLNEPDLRVTVLHVFVSRGGESLASSSVPATGQFQDRLIVKDDGRVTLNSLTPDDLGKYRVEIQQPEDRHIQRSLRLVISEPPETTDGILAVNKLLSPVNNSVRLTCGNFTSLGFPPVSVLWKDTRGNILPSDGFEDQVFYLDLPLSSAVSGDYCCQLDCHAPDYCCLDQRSSLRQCASVLVQTDMVEEVRKVDCPSLDSFTHLQQQVLDLAVALRVLQESDRQDCSHSGVATIAQLVQRQAKCDQLDGYMSRVEDLEDKLKKDLSDVRNDSTDTGLQLETRLMEMFQEFRLQVTDDVSRLADVVDRLETSANNSREEVQTRLEEISGAADDYQLRSSKQIADLEKETKKKINELRTTMGDKLSTIERNLSLQLSDLATMAENLTDYYQALASLDLKTTAQISALEQNVSAIEDALTSHVTNSTQSIAEAWSNVIALFKTTQSLKESLCLFKTGHSLTSGRCMNVSGVEANYQTAQSNCRADGAHLLNLKSRDVDAPVLRNVLAAAGITLPSFYNLQINYWVGANDISTEGSFAWDDGTPLPTSSELWNQMEPNDANNNEDCVEMLMSVQVLILNDNNCEAQRQYICEYDLEINQPLRATLLMCETFRMPTPAN